MAHTLAEALTLGHGMQRSFLCPSHGDSRPSATVNVATGVWYCFTCGARGKVDDEAYEIPLDALDELARELNRAYSPTIYAEAWLNQFDAGPNHPYWLTRFTEDAVRHFRLGYDLSSDAVTYPFRDNNFHVLGVVRRRLGAEHDGPKYLYPRGLKVSDYLFNYSCDQRRVVVLVEGALDAVALWEAGVTAFAIYGSRLSERQHALIRRTGAHRVLCAFDVDAAGDDAYVRVAEELTDLVVEQVTWDAGLGKDVAELPVQTRKNLFANRLEKTTEECRVGTWHSRSSGSNPPLRQPSGSVPSGTTSGLGRMKIVRSR